MRRLWAFCIRVMLLLAGGIFAFAVTIAGLKFPWVGVAVLILAAWRRFHRGHQASGNFGFARFAGWFDLIRGRLIGGGDSGWFIGRPGHLTPPTRGQAIRSLLSPFVPSELAVRQCLAAFLGGWGRDNGFIRIQDGVHAGIFAPAGAGKSTKVLGPNLFSYPGNCVVIDPKGELYELTNEHRQTHFGHTIIRLDPALVCGPGANCFNPFDHKFIDPHASDFLDRVRDLANTLVVRAGTEPEPFWSDAAENVIAAFAAHVIANEPKEELRTPWGMRLLLASRENYAHALAEMQKNEEFDGVLQQLGGQLSWFVDKQLGSVMSMAQRHTNIFDSPLITDATGGTDWDPTELRSGKMTVYVIVPGDRLVIWAGWMRMVLGSILRIITRGRPTEQNPVTFFVDEAAHIGRMQALEDGITLMRGMGIRIFLCFQSIDQVNKCFGDRAATVLDNLGTQLYFGITSYQTAEEISKRIGEFTLRNTTYGSNFGSSRSTGVKSDGGSTNNGTSISTVEQGLRLVRPEEIMTMDESEGLLFHKNYPVIMCNMRPYYSDNAFRWHWWRGYGTGRSRGLGLGGMALALIALALSGLATLFVAHLPVPVRQRPRAVAPGEFFDDGSVEPWRQPGFQPARRSPFLRRDGRPLPYRFE
jgi:type IV secretion system protein VirD4